VFADEGVVVEMRIGGVDTRDFSGLARAESFVWIETPGSFEKSLASENFVEAGDAAGKIVSGVEEGGVAICDFYTFSKEFNRKGNPFRG